MKRTPRFSKPPKLPKPPKPFKLNPRKPFRLSFAIRHSPFAIRRKRGAPPYGLKPPAFLESFWPLTLPVVRWFVRWLRLMGWLCVDAARGMAKRRDKRVHLYGIWCFVGLPGAGKTMSLVRYLESQRRRYGDKIYIVTNFYYAGQDFHLSGWNMLLKEYDRPVIFAWDELQNEFNSRQYRTFPVRLVHELTQNRKGNGKQVVFTTQKFGKVDNNFRDLTNIIVDCRTSFGRYTKCRHYRREVFLAREEAKSVRGKVENKHFKKEAFIQTDYLRSRYDSFQRLDYLKGLDYEGLRSDGRREGDKPAGPADDS